MKEATKVNIQTIYFAITYVESKTPQLTIINHVYLHHLKKQKLMWT
jgi:hypothetical protein